MKYIPWSDDNEPTSFYTIIEPVIKAIQFAYKLERQNIGKDIPWDGLDIGEKEKSSSLSPHERLNAESLESELENQGREPLDIIIAIAVQLGIEQGRRMEKSSSYNPCRKTALQLTKLLLENALKEFKELEKHIV